MEQMRQMTYKPGRDFVEFDIAGLPQEIKREVLTAWTKADAAMRVTGQKKAVEDVLMPTLGDKVVARTEKGEMVGQAIQYGIVHDDDDQFRKSVWVYVPSSGSVFEVSPKLVRPAGDDDRQRMSEQLRIASRVPQATEVVQKMQRDAREKTIQGSHLLPKMLAAVLSKGLSQKEQTGFVKITGAQKKRAVYVARKGGRVDLSGFAVEHDSILQISEEEAKAKHIGNVRGQIDFDREDDEIMAGFDAALDGLL